MGSPSQEVPRGLPTATLVRSARTRVCHIEGTLFLTPIPTELRLSRHSLRDVAGLLLILSGGILSAYSQEAIARGSQPPHLHLQSDSNAFSSVEPPDAPAAEADRKSTPQRKIPSWKPFSAFAVALKIGSGGIGPEFATPLNQFMNLRGSFQLFDHPLHFRTSGIYSAADLTIQNAAVMVDLFPFHSGFHISPGVTIYGDNHLTSNLTVPGGTAFLLGPDGYTSNPNDPVTGIGRIKFGNPVSPRFTLGWGNLLPRNGRRFSVPFEIGFQYTSQPTLQIALNGSVCDPNKSCGPVSEGTEPQDLQTEINEIESDLAPLRFYPIVSIGFSYRIGH